jgi:hypothetical protein
LKYFIKELWPGTFGIDETDSAWEHLGSLLENRTRLYREELSTISDRLDKEVYRHFATADFHGYSVEKMELVQNDHGVEPLLLMKIYISNELEQYEMLFNDIQSFEVAEVESAHNNSDAVLWGYSEILSVDEKILSFETILSSGMNIYIEFPNKALKIKHHLPSTANSTMQGE